MWRRVIPSCQAHWPELCARAWQP